MCFYVILGFGIIYKHITLFLIHYGSCPISVSTLLINPLNTELNPICHFMKFYTFFMIVI
jgi:hypothetical protein